MHYKYVLLADNQQLCIVFIIYNNIYYKKYLIIRFTSIQK